MIGSAIGGDVTLPRTHDRLDGLRFDSSEATTGNQRPVHSTMLSHEHAELLVDVVGKKSAQDRRSEIYVPLAPDGSPAMQHRIVRSAK